MPPDPDLHRKIRWGTVSRDEMTPEIVAEVQELYQRSFGSWPQWELPTGVSPLDHLAWKASDPHTDLAFFGGRLNGRLVHAATLRADDLLLQGERARQIRFVDTSVHPELRGRGVAGAAMADVQDRHLLPRALRIGEPQHSSIRAWYSDRNRPLGNRVWLHARILDPARCLDAVAAGGRPRIVAMAMLRAAWAWGRLRAALAPPVRTLHVERRERFAPEVDDLFTRAASGFDLIHARDAAYLDWRFCDPRGGGFSLLAIADDDGSWQGYAVTCVRRGLGYLADLLVEPDRIGATDSLVTAAVADLEKAGAAAVVCWLPKHHPYRPPLARRGFVAVRDAGVSYRPEDWSPERLQFLDAPDVAVHYTIGDTDLV